MGASKTKTLNWHFILLWEGFGRVTKLVQQTDNAGLSFCTLLPMENAGFELLFLCAGIYQK